MVHLQVLLMIGAAVILPAKAANSCPAEFLRLSSHHSYCQPNNPTCKMVYAGVTEEDKKAILDVHNKLRSNVAVGKDNSNGLPTASNMLQMEWDDTLAAIAQTYAYQCLYKHDCGDCRSIADYSVGQNMAQGTSSCYTNNCAGGQDNESKKPDWASVIQSFYNERKFVSSSVVKTYVFQDIYGHFSQLAWAETWKIGCGYTVYLTGSKSLESLYVCNYGPSGNWRDKPMYLTGSACSSCPTNSQCGASYPGLCKLNDPSKPPKWKKDEDSGKTIIYNCDFTENSKCAYNIQGSNNWRIFPRVFGPTALVVLNGGESTTMNFLETIKPKSKFCLTLVLRKGPNVDGTADMGNLKANIKMGSYNPWVVNAGMDTKMMLNYNYPCFKENTTFSLSFSVPRNAPAQYLEIRRAYAYLGDCQR